VDALLLQETHYYTNGEHFQLIKQAKSQGWTAHFSHGSKSDTAAGVAILIRSNSQSGTAAGPAATVLYPGRAIALECVVCDVKTSLVSVYLNAQASSRKKEINALKSKGLQTEKRL
jgi:exonuclease III